MLLALLRNNSLVCRSAPAGLDRLTGLRAALSQPSRQNKDSKQSAARGSNAASPPPRRAGRSKAFSPESLRRHEERASKVGASRRPGGDGGSNNRHEFRSSRPGGFDDTRPGFLSGRRPTFPSSAGVSYSASKSNSNSNSRRRPRTATATGRAKAEAWRKADARDGFGTTLGSGSGADAAGKRRPRSAISRFHTSPGRDRARDSASEQDPSGGHAIGEGSGGGVAAMMGWKADGVTDLPDGWAEATDEESGHVYYYSDKR